ncbi:arginine--tRNA ligase [Legionella spiritensis]|uniref:Arginine--tRNA ligase n=1 Tax=Legionella spiritensis TaxID=452 RepID=A0A0W0YXF0_LEGSP|nr:arginine--tRNA ligase [Legionella spiritensis]KTD61545.1 arginyl-tRNA synthetase [Legionella spiritensis]SNV32588.1 arginyl tRNA synthetase [Legionella spiritensis]VEG92281.1 arginyl tRNA synthetase [Legionella spiritensis]
MKQTVEQLLALAMAALKKSADIPQDVDVEIRIERSKEPEHGDFSTNLAMVLAKPCRQSPRQLAQLLISHLPEHPSLLRTEIAGPGFINFFMNSTSLLQVIQQVLHEGEAYGRVDIGQGRKVILEFVSANPTGPLHVGHGRGAAFGATLANVLQTAGYDVYREYYVNDAGRQMNILAVSVWLRYLALVGEAVVFPVNGYRGDYVSEIAEKAIGQCGYEYRVAWTEITRDLPADETDGGDKELYIDALILRARSLLGEEGFKRIHQLALESVLADIKEDLAEFGVDYDGWFSEQSMMDNGAIDKAVRALKDAGHTYEREGAIWFKATDFGDEKDRVLIRANGQPTYFASDVAYHWNKYDRGFDRVIDVFGADHHGYVTRIREAVKALGHGDDFDILLVQFAILYRGGERVQMSTRSGSFVTLRELRQEVGNDAARFFYVMRKPEQHMDFDLDLAKSESSDNPVYYIQYAHARISSVLRQLQERGLSWDEAVGMANLDKLQESHEQSLITMMSRYPEVITSAARSCEPHQVAYYLRELANNLHSYYNAVQLLCQDEVQRAARLCLLKAVRQVLRNGLQLLGVSSPESM